MNNKKALDPKTKKTNAIIFFIFYIIFFSLMFKIFQNVNTPTTPKKEEPKILDTSKYSIEKILVNKPLPTIIIKENDKDIVLEKNYIYKNILKIENINQIVKKGKLINKKEEAKKVIFEYEIENKEINKVLENKEEINQEVINITLTAYNNDVEKVYINLTNYVKQYNKKIENYTIEIDYNNTTCDSITCEEYLKSIIYEE